MLEARPVHANGHAPDQRDRRDAIERIGRGLEQRHVGRQGIGSQHQRVTIGRAVDQRLGRDVGAGARPVVHDHRLAERGLQVLSDRARDDVHRAAGAVTDDDANGFGGKGLRAHARATGDGDGGEQGLASCE